MQNHDADGIRLTTPSLPYSCRHLSTIVDIEMTERSLPDLACMCIMITDIACNSRRCLIGGIHKVYQAFYAYTPIYKGNEWVLCLQSGSIM